MPLIYKGVLTQQTQSSILNATKKYGYILEMTPESAWGTDTGKTIRAWLDGENIPKHAICRHNSLGEHIERFAARYWIAPKNGAQENGWFIAFSTKNDVDAFMAAFPKAIADPAPFVTQIM